MVISYFNSQSAVESPFRGVNVTSRPSLTAKTLSLSKYGLSESNIWVVMDLCPSAVICTIVSKHRMLTRVILELLTMRWICPGR